MASRWRPQYVGVFLGDMAPRIYTCTGTLSRSPLHQAAAQSGCNTPKSLLKGEKISRSLRKRSWMPSACYNNAWFRNLILKRIGPMDQRMRCVEDTKWRNLTRFDED